MKRTPRREIWEHKSSAFPWEQIWLLNKKGYWIYKLSMSQHKTIPHRKKGNNVTNSGYIIYSMLVQIYTRYAKIRYTFKVQELVPPRTLILYYQSSSLQIKFFLLFHYVLNNFRPHKKLQSISRSQGSSYPWLGVLTKRDPEGRFWGIGNVLILI